MDEVVSGAGVEQETRSRAGKMNESNDLMGQVLGILHIQGFGSSTPMEVLGVLHYQVRD